MRGPRAAAAALALLVLLAAAGATAAPPSDPVEATLSPRERATPVPQSGTTLSADRTVIRIAVRPDGSAVWEVQYRVALDGANATAAFEAARDRIEADPLGYTGPYAERMGRAAEAAADVTGRAMEIRNVSVRARKLPTPDGAVTYRFEWTRFASRSDGRLVVGDALVGFALPENSTLLVGWPAGREAEQVSPDPDERRPESVVWEGPMEFAPNEPRVVVSGGGSLPVTALAVAALAVVLASAGVVGWRRWEGTDDERGAAEAGGRDSTASTGAPPGDGAGGASGAETDDSEVPEELLSDPERVLNLLEERGGRMKQQDVVAELDWSETKTSQVVNDLKEEGKVEVYRLGRENVVSLPGEMDV